jgi:hypothetical protein
MFNKLLSIGVALAIMGSAAWAAQIGDTVQSLVPLSGRVNVPGSALQNLPTEVTHITLDDGVWSISGQINFWGINTAAGSILFIAGNISKDTVTFAPRETAAVQAAPTLGGNLIGNFALTPRVVEVTNGTEVFLVAGNFNPTQIINAWGFMSAVKVRNHVP